MFWFSVVVKHTDFTRLAVASTVTDAIRVGLDKFVEEAGLVVDSRLPRDGGGGIVVVVDVVGKMDVY